MSSSRAACLCHSAGVLRFPHGLSDSEWIAVVVFRWRLMERGLTRGAVAERACDGQPGRQWDT